MVSSTIKEGNQMTVTDKIEAIISATEEAANGAGDLYMEMVEIEAINDLDTRRFEEVEEALNKLEAGLEILYRAQGTSQRFDKSQQQATA
jgi:hypothetical protein